MFADNSSLCILEDYNLQGLKITSSSLTWEPYLKITNCNQDQRTGCTYEGALYELALEAGQM